MPEQAAEYLDICFDESLELLATRVFNTTTIMLVYREKGEFIQSLPISSEIIATFVTCHARLSLYELMDQLQERVVYVDTDSVVYTHKQGQLDLPEGSFLGELTNELSKLGPHAYITEFVTGGPKNYGYKVS